MIVGLPKSVSSTITSAFAFRVHRHHCRMPDFEADAHDGHGR